MRLRGELDLASASQFTALVLQALSSVPLVIVDLRELAFLDVDGVHRLLEADAQAVRTGRQLMFVRGERQVDRMFGLFGLADRLQIVELGPGEAQPPMAGRFVRVDTA